MPYTVDLRHKPDPVPTPPAPPVAPHPTPSPEPRLTAPEPELELSPVPQEKLLSAGEISWATVMHPAPLRETAYWAAGLLVAAGIASIVFRYDALFGAGLLLAAVVILMRAHAAPHHNLITLRSSTLTIDERVYPFREIKSFWIQYQTDLPRELIVELKKSYLPILQIPLEDANPLEIRASMVQYIPEKEHVPSLIDHIVRLLGF